MKRGAQAIQQQAAEWLARREARAFTAAEHAAFAEWCAADARHPAAFAEVEAAWRTFDRLARYPHSVDVAADPDLLARPGRGRWPRIVLPALAAAAALAVAGIWWWPHRNAGGEKAVAPSIAQVGPRVLRLEDGSEVELNAGSEVTAQFTPTERRVRLVRGEAHFTVAKNAARPFIVDAGGVAVRAVGTAFNVRLAAEAIEVLVTEGRVQVSPPASDAADAPPAVAVAPAELGAGQRVIVPTVAAPAAAVLATSTPVVETLSAPALDEALSWQTNRLVFDAVPLGEVVARINQQSGGRARLVVRDASLAGLRISGRLRADHVENFVEVLEANFGIVAERRADGLIVLRRR